MSKIASRLIANLGILGLLCLYSPNAAASDLKDSVKTSVKLATSDDLKTAKNIWLSTSNAAGFALYGFEPIGDISLSMSRKSGDFKQIQDAGSINDFTINAKGYDKVKNFSFYGNSTTRESGRRIRSIRMYYSLTTISHIILLILPAAIGKTTIFIKCASCFT